MKLFILLVALPILCTAHTDFTEYITETDTMTTVNNDHSASDTPETSTQDRNEVPIGTDHEELTTSSPQRACRSLRATHNFVLEHRDVIDNVAELNCTCELEGINLRECPQWKGVYDTLHSYKRVLSHDRCTVILKIMEMKRSMPYTIYCADVMSDIIKETTVHLAYVTYGDPCLISPNENNGHYDCIYPFVCKGNNSEYGTCLCPEDRPVYYYPRQCYPVAKLSERCYTSVQCKSSDRNAYCLSSDGSNNTMRRCLCGPGYEVGCDGTCVCEDCGLKYVYSVSKQHYIVFYVLLSLSLLFILIGVLKACLLHRRAIARKTGVVVSTKTEDSKPIVEAENPIFK